MDHLRVQAAILAHHAQEYADGLEAASEIASYFTPNPVALRRTALEVSGTARTVYELGLAAGLYLLAEEVAERS